MNAKDFLGKDIKVGDNVIFAQLQYRNFLIGKIVKVTPKTVLIEHDKTNTGSKQTRQDHAQVILYNK